MEHSRGDLVCLHLADCREAHGTGSVPRGVTVAGIAEALELGDSVADRVDLLGDLERLREEGLIEADVVDVEGRDRPRRGYRLTEAGSERAARVRERVADRTVAVTNGVDVEVPIVEMDRYFDRAPLVRALARMTDDGRVPVDRSVGEAFTDRTDEMATLESALEAALNRGGRGVVVTGESGVGKSTLVEAFLDRIRDHDPAPAVAVGRCEADATTPYRVFRRAFADLPSGTEIATLLDEAPAVPDDEPGAVRAQRRALYADVATAVRDVAAERPVVLVVEDLHLADGASLSLLSYLVENVTEWIYPVLFVATVRSGAVDPDGRVAAFVDDLAGSDRHRRIDLDPLDVLDTRVILRRVLGTDDLPDAFVGAVHDQTGGNPLFVEETGKRLRDAGAADPAAGQFPESSDALPVPDRVVDAVDERLAPLDAAGHDVLGLGAVVGTEVPTAVLAAASDLDPARLFEYADLLVGSNVWERDGDDLRFVHGVVRETILERLDDRTRRRFHRRVADALETVHADDRDAAAGRIAHHYRAAGDDRAALEDFVRAGDHAAGIYAHEDAIDHYRSALELAGGMDADPAEGDADDGDRPWSVPAIAALLADVHLTVGEIDRAAETVRRGREADPDPREARRLATLAGRIALRRGDYERAREAVTAALDGDDESTGETPDLLEIQARAERHLDEYDRATATAERMRDVATGMGVESSVADAHHVLGLIARERGEFGTAREHFRTALSTYRDLDDRIAAAKAEDALGYAAFRQGEYDAAADLLESALETAREVGHQYQTAATRMNLGTVLMRRGEYERAREHYGAALSTFEAAGNRHEVADARHNLGMIASQQGDHERALDHYEAALPAKEAVGDERGAALTRHNVGYEARHLGEYERSREAFEAALGTFRAVGDRHHVGTARGNLGALARKRGNHDRAREHLEAALEIFDEVGSPRWEGLAHRELGELALAEGDNDAARDRCETALSTFEELGATDEAIDTLRALVEVSREQGDGTAARSFAEQGLAALDGIDAGEEFAAQRDLFRETLEDPPSGK